MRLHVSLLAIAASNLFLLCSAAPPTVWVSGRPTVQLSSRSKRGHVRGHDKHFQHASVSDCLCSAGSAAASQAAHTDRIQPSHLRACQTMQVHLKGLALKDIESLNVGGEWRTTLDTEYDVEVGGTYVRNELYVFPKVSHKAHVPSCFGAAHVKSAGQSMCCSSSAAQADL